MHRARTPKTPACSLISPCALPRALCPYHATPQPPPSSNAAARSLRRAELVRRRGHTAPLHLHPCQPPPQLHLDAGELLEPTILYPEPCSARISPERNSGEPCPPPRLLTTGELHVSLTPTAPSQIRQESNHGIQTLGAPLPHPRPRAPPVTRRSTSPLTSLHHASAQFGPQ